MGEQPSELKRTPMGMPKQSRRGEEEETEAAQGETSNR